MSPLIKIFQPRGILDATESQKFRQEIAEVVDSGAKIVLVDFKNVTFMDSSGLGALVLAFKALRDADIKLFICSINEQVRILFELTGMDKIFEILPSREEFNQTVLSKI